MLIPVTFVTFYVGRIALVAEYEVVARTLIKENKKL